MKEYTEGWCEAADGTRLFYSVAGPGRPTSEPDLVLCDGIGCAGFVWKYLVATFSDRHRVIRWHYRGHGRSEVPADLDRLSVYDVVDDLHCVLEALTSAPAVLLGHSMGVQIILEAHRQHPEHVRGLVPICGSFGNPLDTFHDGPYLKKTFPYLYWAFTGFPEHALRLWQTLLPSRTAYWAALAVGEVNRSLIRWDDLQPYFEHLGQIRPEVFVRMLSSAARHTTRDHLPSVDVPALVIGAEQDTFTPVWLSNEMAERIPGAEVLIVPKGSHAAPIEQPDLVNLRIEKFFRERLGSYKEPAQRKARGEAPAGRAPKRPGPGKAGRRRSA